MTMTNQAISIFVISLGRAPERRAAIKEHLDSLGLQYEMVDAVDGNELSQEEIEGYTKPGFTYIAGVIGCYLSHILVYEKIIEKNLQIALILEDDALLNPKFVEVLRSGVQYTDFDYCLLDSDQVSEANPVFYDPDTRQELATNFPVYETNIPPALLHAYLITNEGAKKRVNCAFPIEKPIDVHTYLPIPFKFLVCVEPKGASVSEFSRRSFTSSRNDTSPLRFRGLRRLKIYFKLRDLLRLSPVRSYITKRRLLANGKLQKGRRWRPLPEGRQIV